ncbi:MAG: 4-hydroxybutyrate dehydrogenase, partial [Burkholderiaceae bacterium]
MALIKYITDIEFDFGAVATLPASCAAHGISKPLLVTDAGIKAAGLLDKVLAHLGALPVVVFDQTPSNPTEAAVRAASDLYISQGCNGIVALGGGSSIDCAKGVAILATHGGVLTTYATIEG